MNAKILAFVAVTLLSASHSIAHASWTNAVVLTSVYLRPASGAGDAPELQLKVAPTSTWGGGCASDTVLRTSDDRLQDHYVSMAISAHLSGKPIMIYTDSTCQIQRMQF